MEIFEKSEEEKNINFRCVSGLKLGRTVLDT